MSRIFEPPCKLNIFENATGHRHVATNCFVSSPSHQDVLPIGNRHAVRWIIDSLRRISARQFGKDYRHQSPFSPGYGLLFRGIGKQIDAAIFHFSQCRR